MSNLYLNHEEADGSGSSAGPYTSVSSAEFALQQALDHFSRQGERWSLIKDNPNYHQNQYGDRLWIGPKR